jgi:hypothetical protein
MHLTLKFTQEDLFHERLVRGRWGARDQDSWNSHQFFDKVRTRGVQHGVMGYLRGWPSDNRRPPAGCRRVGHGGS